MKQSKLLMSAIFAAVTLAFLANVVAAQSASDGPVATVTGGGSSVRWDIAAANSGGTLTINFPDGRSIRKTFRQGASPHITIGEKYFDNLTDGVYVYEIQLASAPSDAAIKARGKDDDPESVRAARRRRSASGMTQSGSFAVVNGSIVVAGSFEPEQKREPKASTAPAAAPVMRATASENLQQRIRNNHRAFFKPDFVIADDLVVQGSACVGLDCVNNEPFNFDTIRMKENNTRILFLDTSTSAGFATNDWIIKANDSGSGGASYLGIVDHGNTGTGSETGTIIAQFDAGASANSLRVSSTGRVGLKTATPVLALHINESDTPDIRLEQNNTGGFSAQTWDIAGNEANFFVRDVTGGSLLPFRIRPGAPTSSLDISANGNVGIATASPGALLHVVKSGDAAQLVARFQSGDNLGSNDVPFIEIIADSATDRGGQIASNPSGVLAFFTNVATPGTLGTEVMRLTETSRVGIGTAAPDQTLSVNGDASKTGGNTWLAFSDERLKTIKGRFNTGLRAVMQLQPIRYEYLKDNALGLRSVGEHIGFGAQTLEKIIPEAVTKNGDGYLMVNSDPIIWTMLNAIKEQQQQIAQLKAEVRKLKTAARGRRR